MQQKNSLQVNFSSELARLLRLSGKKQRELAAFAGVSPSAVTKWLAGTVPGSEFLDKISRFFGVPVSALFNQDTENGTPVVNKPQGNDEICMPLKQDHPFAQAAAGNYLAAVERVSAALEKAIDKDHKAVIEDLQETLKLLNHLQRQTHPPAAP